MALRKMSAEEARNLLRTVEDDAKAFWFSYGFVAHNLAELDQALDQIGEENFSYHVNGEKNDLADWVNNIIGDVTLAKQLRRLQKPSATAEAVKRRIVALEAALLGA